MYPPIAPAPNTHTLKLSPATRRNIPDYGASELSVGLYLAAAGE
jgi:hypothetical protein